MKTTRITKKDGEYRVRLFVDGVYQPDADYFTDDKDDAEGTAKVMVGGRPESRFCQDRVADHEG